MPPMSLSSLLRGSFRCRPVALFIDIIQNLFGVDFGFDFLGSENLLYYAFLVYEVSGAQDAYCLAATGNLLTPATQLLKQSRFGVGDEGELQSLCISKLLLQCLLVLAHSDNRISGCGQLLLVCLQ